MKFITRCPSASALKGYFIQLHHKLYREDSKATKIATAAKLFRIEEKLNSKLQIHRIVKIGIDL